MKFKFVFVSQFILISNLWAADANLKPVHEMFYGQDPTHPASHSLLYQYLSETSAKTIVRKFPKGPVNNPVGDQTGVDKLVVAVSPETFPVFLKYFSQKNFFYAISLIGDSHMQIAFKEKSAQYGPPLRDKFHFNTEGIIMVPLLLDDNEAARLETYFEIYNSFHWGNRNSLFYPDNIKTIWGGQFFPHASFWESCAAWFANLPIGNKMVDTYYFPSVKGEKSEPLAHELRYYVLANPKNNYLLHKIWHVPGNQQLGDMLDHGALARGEFHNGGWILYNLLGSIGNDRTPVIFLQVNDETKEINPNFPINISVNYM